jgi:hypothetical protein
LVDFGTAKGSVEIGANPGKSLRAVILGALIVMTMTLPLFSTHKRIVIARQPTGCIPMNGWISALATWLFHLVNVPTLGAV